METLLQDLRYSVRMLAKAPGFAAVAVLILAMGIGANTAIFTLVDAVMLRSLSVRDPTQLVILQWRAHKPPEIEEYSSFSDCGESGISGPSGCSFALPIFEQIRSQTNVFSGVTAFAGPAALDLSGNGPASIVSAEIVSGDYFSTLGVSTALGRTLGQGDDSLSASPAAVLSYAYWQSAFGGSPSVLGRSILLNKVAFTIVGVADPGFTNLSPGKTQDLWLPIAMVPRLGISWGSKTEGLTNWWLLIMARLKPGVSLAEAEAATGLTFRNEVLYGPKPLSRAADDPRIFVTLAQEGLVGRRGQISKTLYFLTFAVGIILVIACANVAGLLLSRAATRQKEIAVRLALGAGRATVLRQLLTESVLLSLLGGIFGILVAYWGVRAIAALMTSGSGGRFPYLVTPDWRVLSFGLGVSLLTGIAFGLAPAFRSTRVDLAYSLKENASTFPGRSIQLGRFHMGSALVVAQVALSVLVLIGAGLLVRTLQNLRDINPGFDARNVLVFQIDPTLLGYKDTQIEDLYGELREHFAALPGVTSVSYSSAVPLSGGRWTETVHVEGQPQSPNVEIDMFAAGPEFFATMHIPQLDGRMFTAADFEEAAQASAASKTSEKKEHPQSSTATTTSAVAAGPPAAVSVLVNEAFVRRYFPNETPLGKRIIHTHGPGASSGSFGTSPNSRNWQIVGIVADTKYVTLRRQIEPTIYVPFTSGGAYFELRTALDPHALIATVRNVASKVDNNLPLSHVRTQTQVIDELLSQERMVARLSGFFGVLALLLACIGLYGLLSYEVSRRTREIGVRMALGAHQGDVLRLVVGRGIVLVVLGTALGMGTAMGVTRYLASMLYDVHANDPLTLIGVAVILAIVALAACYLPARRATRVDPMVALRYE